MTEEMQKSQPKDQKQCELPASYTFDSELNMYYFHLGAEVQPSSVHRSVETQAVIDYDYQGNVLGFEIFGVNPKTKITLPTE